MGLQYIGGELHFGINPRPIRGFLSGYEHPFYLYDLEHVLERFSLMQSYLPKGTSIHYAMKANGSPVILKALKEAGAKVDTVSQGEIEQALAAGFTPDDVVFSGIGKSRAELHFAISKGIRQINVESLAELERIGEISKSLKRDAQVGIRINPDVDPETHPYITTGFKENKFGMGEEALPQASEILRAYPSLKLVGLSMHIGSQILDIDDFRDAVRKTRMAYERLQSEGWPMGRIDVGGGVGINYRSGEESQELELMKSYGAMLGEELGSLDCELMTEPGRWIVARSGILVSEVQYVKETEHRKFLVVDTGMHHLIRPALYQAFHRILPVNEYADAQWGLRDVVGPICESSDFLGKDHHLPQVKQGDYLVIAEAGAYGFSMASGYNGHPMPEEKFLKR